MLSSSVLAVFTPTWCWNLDTDATAISEDCSGTNRYRITTIASDHTASGKFGGARNYEQDNSDQDEMNNSVGSIGSSGCLGAWVKAEDAQANNGEVLCQSATGSFLCAGVNTGGQAITARLNGQAGALSPHLAGVGTWVHIVAVYSASVTSIYVNGTLLTTQAGAYGLNTDISDMVLGGRGAGTYWDGIIDEAFVHNGTCTAAEVSEIYNRTTSWGQNFPAVTVINFTSDGGSIRVWNNGTNTTDRTPTFALTTDVDGQCKFAADADVNYTSMNLSCTQNGNYNTSHSCTFPTELSLAQHTVYFSCNGTTGLFSSTNATDSSKTNITLVTSDIAPTINLASPATNKQLNDTFTDIFEWNASDDTGTTLNCTLRINGTNQGTNLTLNNTATYRQFTDLRYGLSTWLVNCTDKNNSMTTSSSRNIYVNDTRAAVITLNEPSGGMTFGVNPSITFNMTVVDATSTTTNCTLYINGTINATNSSVLNGTSTSWVASNFTNGTRSWLVNCTDAHNNKNFSENRTFVVGSVATTGCQNVTQNVTLSGPALSNITTLGSGSCFNFLNDSLTFDCNSVAINWSGNSSLFHAINKKGITIKNCFIFDAKFGGSSTVYSFGYVYNFTNASYTTLYNNTVRLYGVNGDVVVTKFTGESSTHNNTFDRNDEWIVFPASSRNSLLHYEGSESNITRGLYQMTAVLNSLTNLHLFNFTTNANNNSIKYNTLDLTSTATISPVRAIVITASNRNTLEQNNISVLGIENPSGIHLTGSPSDNYVLSNRVVVQSTNSPYGIQMNFAGNRNVLKHNVITVKDYTDIGNEIGSSGTGMYISAGQLNVIVNNTINVTQRSAGTGIDLSQDVSSGQNNVSFNYILVNSTSNIIGETSYGIKIGTTTSSVFHNNTILSRGTNNTGGILVSGSGFKTISNNYIELQSQGIGINMQQNGELTENTINSSSGWLINPGIGGIVLTNLTIITPNGSVKFIGSLGDIPRNLSTHNFRILKDRVFYNTTNETVMNFTANITLFNTSILSPRIVVDYQLNGVQATCPTNRCTAQTLSTGRVIFNVTGWSEYVVVSSLNITLVVPSNGSITGVQGLSGNVTFTWNASATNSTSFNCTLFLNGTSRGFNVTNDNNVSSYRLFNLSAGTRFWNVTCNQSSFNVTSGTQFFTLIPFIQANIQFGPGIVNFTFVTNLTRATYAFVNVNNVSTGITNLSSNFSNNPVINQSENRSVFNITIPNDGAGGSTVVNITINLTTKLGGPCIIYCSNTSSALNAINVTNHTKVIASWRANTSNKIWCWRGYVNATSTCVGNVSLGQEGVQG